MAGLDPDAALVMRLVDLRLRDREIIRHLQGVIQLQTGLIARLLSELEQVERGDE